MEYQSMDDAGLMAAMGTVMFVYGAILLLMVISMWKIFTKAGKPGWASLIPIYNCIVLLEIVGKPVWWIVLLFIPFVNIIIAIMLTHQLSLVFGKGVGMTILLLLVIGYPILAFGSAQYVKPALATQPV